MLIGVAADPWTGCLDRSWRQHVWKNNSVDLKMLLLQQYSVMTGSTITSGKVFVELEQVNPPSIVANSGVVDGLDLPRNVYFGCCPAHQCSLPCVKNRGQLQAAGRCFTALVPGLMLFGVCGKHHEGKNLSLTRKASTNRREGCKATIWVTNRH